MKVSNQTTLALQFGVSRTTIRKWIKQVPKMNLSKGQRVLTPKQLEIFYEHIGTPDGK